MPRFVISAGHGANTPGKRTPDGYREHQFNYPTAQYVADYLNDYENVQILKVYESVRDVPLSERTHRANSWGADLYLSIHYNAYGSGWNNANGIETLVYNQSNSNVGYKVAKEVHPRVIKATGRSNRGIKSRPDLWEMRKTAMGALLIECGFMTNREEANLMKSDSYRRKVARAIVDGLADYYNLRKKKASEPIPKPNKPSNGNLFRVQIGAFSSYRNAKDYEKLAETKGFTDAFTSKEGNLYKVQIGAFSKYEGAVEMRNRAISKGFKGAWIF